MSTPKTPYQLIQSVDETLAAGYAEGAAGSPARRTRAEKVAGDFRPNATQERLLRLRETDPAAFAGLPPATRMGAAYYETAKEAAAATGGGGDRG